MSVLTNPTLVLNKSWHPIDSINVRDALISVASERGVFLNTLDYSQHNIYSWMQLPVKNDNYIMTSQGPIIVPEIMLLTEYNHVPLRKVVFCRKNLWNRDKRRCQYCSKEPKIDEITIDHIVPRSKGGQSTFDNCVLACIECNKKKGNRTLKGARMQLRRIEKMQNGEISTVYYDLPKRPVWNPLYTLKRKTFPQSWSAFLKNFDDMLYWEVELEK